MLARLGEMTPSARTVRLCPESCITSPSGRSEVVPRGTVKWFSQGEWYGVIVQDGGGPDAIVWSTAIQVCCRPRGLTKGDRVCFDIIQDSQGVRAENVCRAEGCGPARQSRSPARPASLG
ncbi:cold-shock protein [Streptomyces sp. NPDC051310]|uniref:cold-shock protein n=1 Tax=Streptomyces sp. NPDC051310 TaxID=3365649 RepID=UPI0037A81F3C